MAEPEEVLLFSRESEAKLSDGGGKGGVVGEGIGAGMKLMFRGKRAHMNQGNVMIAG